MVPPPGSGVGARDAGDPGAGDPGAGDPGAGDTGADDPAGVTGRSADVLVRLAAEVVATLVAARWTVATAESLTGGMVGAALTRVPGSSATYRGGVTAYATDLKHRLLRVDTDLLASRGPVDPLTARQMALGVRTLLGADVGLATTGVAGPGPADGHPAGEVHLGLAWPGGTVTRSLRLEGDRDAVRSQTVEHLLRTALQQLGEFSSGGGHSGPDRPWGARAGATSDG